MSVVEDIAFIAQIVAKIEANIAELESRKAEYLAYAEKLKEETSEG